MLSRNLSKYSALKFVVTLSTAFVVPSIVSAHPSPPANAELSHAYRHSLHAHYQAHPPKNGECSKQVHDHYWEYGPDGKVYPAWHPTVDPETGCKFGHEHGRDPARSKVSKWGIPFGYISEQQTVNTPNQVHRHEDHVGHKIDWANNVEVSIEYENGVSEDAKCNYLVKMHQGTHSPDAFKNNAHETFIYMECDNDLQLQWRALNPFGRPGQVFGKCINSHLVVGDGEVQPSNTPSGPGKRKLADQDCVDEYVRVPAGQASKWTQGIQEIWAARLYGNTDGGNFKIFFEPYFFVQNPSRYFDSSDVFDPDTADASEYSKRTIDLCYETGARRARGPLCDEVLAAKPNSRNPMKFDDVRSPFNGAKRIFFINAIDMVNKTSSNKVYTDVYGKNVRTRPDTRRGIVYEQIVSQKNDYIKIKPKKSSQNRRPKNYDDGTVRAPN